MSGNQGSLYHDNVTGELITEWGAPVSKLGTASKPIEELVADKIALNGESVSDNAALSIGASSIMLFPIVSAPTADSGHAKIYVKSSDLYLQRPGGVETKLLNPNYAGISVKGNSTAVTISLADVYHKIEIFDTESPETLSEGDSGENRVNIGRSVDYMVSFSGNYTAAAGSKVYNVKVYNVNAAEIDITGITEADPGVVTAVDHGLPNGAEVKFLNVGGMVELNDKIFKVNNKTDDTFELQIDGATDLNTTGFTTYTSGGTVQLATATSVENKLIPISAPVSANDIITAVSTNQIEIFVKDETDDTDITFEGLRLNAIQVS